MVTLPDNRGRPPEKIPDPGHRDFRELGCNYSFRRQPSAYHLCLPSPSVCIVRFGSARERQRDFN